ncbi:MAG: adenylate/guanylate cyclase domain-containing protein [Comamonadaceae bacterium]|nr:adenylate/guanylate cyclase domain-containing protein [Comamonadaceae bacterium]
MPHFDMPPFTATSHQFTSLEHSVWKHIQSDLELALQHHNLAKFAAPSRLILHDLLESAVSVLHRHIFRQLVEIDFGLDPDGNDAAFNAFYDTETREHGSQNIDRFCKSHDQQISVTFPSQAGVIAWVDIPVSWNRSVCQTEQLIAAIGFELQLTALAETEGGCRLILVKRSVRQPVPFTHTFLEQQPRSTSLSHIFDSLSYGLMHFSATGEILAVSPSMLGRLGLDVCATSVAIVAEAIPLNFYNDIVWGLALGECSGKFENYRIRVNLPDGGTSSILFNVSGFRDEMLVIHSLWQTVSVDEGHSQLSEGSILTEVRIHNITRNYVPQLVQEKARDAIQLGHTQLTNEERFVAVLFCDIVGFTNYVETSAHHESVIDSLNSILRRVAGSVKNFHGSIDKFMGDCVMALFDDPADAVFAACDMQRHAQDINSLRERAGQSVLQLRIGIHWGEVLIGNVGTVERLDWTAIGDVVNTASRIEKNCRPGAILVHQALRNAIAPVHHAHLNFEEVFYLQVKGKGEKLTVCYVSLVQTLPIRQG